eukprot:6129358-Pleurochrysis_carterae.AAC.1
MHATFGCGTNIGSFVCVLSRDSRFVRACHSKHAQQGSSYTFTKCACCVQAEYIDEAGRLQ